MNTENTDSKIENILRAHNPRFNPGFTDRVMDRIASVEVDILSIFKWIALSGMAAIILLLIAVYFTDGSFSSDAIFGVYNYSEHESLITAYNF